MTSFLRLCRIVGYGLLLLAIFDAIHALIPFEFRNQIWVFQTAGGFVERSAVPLIGFLLVFCGDYESRQKIELFLIKILSWISLLAGVFYFALVMLFFIVPPAIYSQNEASAGLTSKIAQIAQFQIQLEQAETSKIEALMKNNRVPNGSDPQAFKAKLLQEAAAAKKNLESQSVITQNNLKLKLIKDAVKWGLGALVLGTLFIFIWQATDWAR